MKKPILITLLILFLSGCTSPDGEFTRDDANDVRLMVKGMRVDSMYSDIGYNTNYGLATAAVVVLKEVWKAEHLQQQENYEDEYYEDYDVSTEDYSGWPSVVVRTLDEELIANELINILSDDGFIFIEYEASHIQFVRKESSNENRNIEFIFIPVQDFSMKVACKSRLVLIKNLQSEKVSIERESISLSCLQNTLNKLKKNLEEDSAIVQIKATENNLSKCSYPKWVVNLGLESQYASENKCE